jgi:alpha-tubulin suppressor-like RCC1 family protein
MTLGKWLLRFVECSLLLVAGCVSGHAPLEPLGTAQAALTNVTWIDAVGVSTSGNSLTKITTPGWNAGAASNELLPGDGYVEFTTAEATTDKMVGLSHTDPARNQFAIDFALYLSSAAGVAIYEDGVWRASPGAYAAGDVFRIQVAGSQVTYLQNGSLLYTSTKAPTPLLLVGAALYGIGATVENVVLSSGYWQDAVGVSLSGASMTKTGSAGFNAGAATTASLSSDGHVQFTTAEATTEKVVGLSHADPAQNQLAIDFAFHLSSTGGLSVDEDGVSVGSFGTYAAGDVFQIQVTGNQVTYLRNGTLLYTSTAAPILPLLAATALDTPGATVNNVVVTAASTLWQDAVGVSLSGQSMTKSGPTGWNAGATSVASLTGDGYAQFTTAEANTDKMVGLSHTDPAQNQFAIDYALYLSSAAGVAIYEDGALRASPGSYAAGDVFEILVSGSQVTYLQNGSLLYGSTKAPTRPLVAATSLYSTGATVDNVVVFSNPWQDAVGVSVSPQGLTKTGSLGWNAGAASLASLPGSGYAQFTTAEANTDKMVGLSHADPAQSEFAIDFAFHLSGSGVVDIYEDASLAGTFGTYAANDQFEVRVVGTQVTYLQNGNLLYTSTKVPTQPLLFGAVLYTPGATVNNVVLAPFAVAAGTAHTCALTTGSGAKCWGNDVHGQLGNGSTTDSHVPFAVPALPSGVAAISAAFYHTCALTTGGAALCWGDNTFGELGNNSVTDSRVPVAVSGLSSGVAAISAGGYGTAHTCAVTTGGGALCWGDNTYGQLGNNSTTTYLAPVAVSGLSSGVAAIAAGAYSTCALTTAGAVLCWGDNVFGELGNNSTTSSLVPVAVPGLSSGVAAIAAGHGYACALTTAGAVQCWGYNFYGQLGNNSVTNSNVPVAVSGLASGVVALTAGSDHACALTTGGAVLCWGNNSNGQTGGTTLVPTALVPAAAAGLSSGVAAIAGGYLHTCAETTAGSFLCWGWNGNGELGIGSTTDSRVPVAVH